MALLNTLSYLDFKLIEKEKREKALEIFEIRVKELEHKEEKLMKIKIKEEKEQFELNQVCKQNMTICCNQPSKQNRPFFILTLIIFSVKMPLLIT